jgi:hypothetical protein
MPLFRYFAGVGSFLLAALFTANWYISAPTARAPEFDRAPEHKANIRINTDHKWPERVVFDTSGSALAQAAGAGSGVSGSEPPVVAERRPFDAFAEMAAVSVGACFRAPAPPARPQSGRPRRRGRARFLKFARA